MCFRCWRIGVKPRRDARRSAHAGPEDGDRAGRSVAGPAEQQLDLVALVDAAVGREGIGDVGIAVVGDRLQVGRRQIGRDRREIIRGVGILRRQLRRDGRARAVDDAELNRDRRDASILRRAQLPRQIAFDALLHRQRSQPGGATDNQVVARHVVVGLAAPGRRGAGRRNLPAIERIGGRPGRDRTGCAALRNIETRIAELVEEAAGRIERAGAGGRDGASAARRQAAGASNSDTTNPG